MKVVISTGGTGGHIFPAIETGIVLKARGHEVFFAGAIVVAKDKITNLGFKFFDIPASGFTDKSLMGMFRFMKHMMKAITQAGRYLDETRPDKVIGFGGYGSFAVTIAAVLKRYPTMIHEQNVVPGKANKLLGSWVKKVAVSFKETMPRFGSKAIWTGCPCHSAKISKDPSTIRLSLGLNPESKVVVLMGGSQGSKFLNDLFFQCWPDVYMTGNVQAIHITGKVDFDVYKEKYEQAGWPAYIKPFYSPIEDIYAIADCVISRAGAATVCELGHFGTLSILVPYPFAHAHQMHNASVLAKTGSATVLDQNTLTKDILSQAIIATIAKQIDHKAIQTRGQEFFIPNAAEQLANALERL